MNDKNQIPAEMLWYYPEGHEAHSEIGHPERPERVEAIRQALVQEGWWDSYPQAAAYTPVEEQLRWVHTPSYLETLHAASLSARYLDGDTYTTRASWDLALQAAGGAIAVAEGVWRGRARSGFALTRPPGHHATPTHGMGFCLLNNIALAAEFLLRQDGAQRLAIVDFDLHHGNGTQEVFWERPDVFYLSTHQTPLYPGTGAFDETGSGAGRGTTANFPLPPGSGDKAFMTILQAGILPLLDRFCPEMILVSYGFDPHWRDPLGHLQLSATGYGALIGGLKTWANTNCSGRIALFLEGGYDLDAGKACSLAVSAALLNLPFQDPLGLSPRPEGKSWQAYFRRVCELWNLEAPDLEA